MYQYQYNQKHKNDKLRLHSDLSLLATEIHAQ